ncbi:MAG TPA: zinc finger domain-containing protein [Candidatus Nanoarchaeia archaeon]|nr:zinc finger domain-containing protein [Candidatus Nanoarchaeia archaeon]
MKTYEMHCSSCKTQITNISGTVKFKCPSCGNTDLVRCTHCREIAARYKCESCEFSGPN